MNKKKDLLLLAGVVFFALLMCGCQSENTSAVAEATNPTTIAEDGNAEKSSELIDDEKAAEGVTEGEGSEDISSDQNTSGVVDEVIKTLRTYDDETMTNETYYSEETNATYQLYNSSLPVIYINTEEEIFINYSSADMYIMGNETWTDKALFYDGEVEIKLRGNSTKYREKSPYKIKLDSKSDLFGMGKSKHWVLLANDIDHSLIRNKLVLDLAEGLGMESTSSSVLVTVILNGEYQGVYQLCEHIRVEEERVNIFDWEELAEDASDNMAEELGNELTDDERDSMQKELEDLLCEDFAWLSAEHTILYNDVTYDVADYVTIPEAEGGFLLEMDFYAFNDWELSTLITNFKQPLYFNTPEFVSENSLLYQYADTFIQSFEYALHSDDFVYDSTDTHYIGQGDRYDRRSDEWTSFLTETEYTDKTFDHMHYTDLFELDSLVNNFLVCEFTMNWDCMKNSMFVNKDIGEKAEIGPVWDFDWAFGNINMYNIDTYITDDWQTTNNYFTNEQYYQSVQWNRYLIKDPYFVMKVFEKYKEVRDGVIADTVTAIDTYHESLAAAGAANDERWDYTYHDRSCYSGENSEDFEDSMESLKAFVTERVEWLDEQFVSFDVLLESLGAYEVSKDLRISSTTESEHTMTLQARVTDNNIKQVVFQVNGTVFATGIVEENTARVTIDKDIIENGMNMIVLHAADESGNYLHIGNESEAQTVSNYYILKR